MDVTGYGSVGLQVTGTFSATVTFEGTIDYQNWVAMPVLDTAGARQTTATAAGLFTVSTVGVVAIRARVSAYTSGSVTVGGVGSLTAIPTMVYTSGTTVTVDTEFPAAAALADDTANPTTTVVGSMVHVWDGAGWDRAPGDATNGVDVDVIRLPAESAGMVASTAQVTLTQNVATQLSGSSVPTKSIVVVNDDGAASNGNTAVIWVGGTSVAANNGIPLRPGQSVELRVDNANDVWFFTASADQKISWSAAV